MDIENKKKEGKKEKEKEKKKKKETTNIPFDKTKIIEQVLLCSGTVFRIIMYEEVWGQAGTLSF